MSRVPSQRLTGLAGLTGALLVVVGDERPSQLADFAKPKRFG